MKSHFVAVAVLLCAPLAAAESPLAAPGPSSEAFAFALGAGAPGPAGAATELTASGSRRSATLTAVHGINVGLSALLAGMWAGTWVEHYEKRNVSLEFYVEQQTQPSIFGALMPALMFATMLSHGGVMGMVRDLRDPKFILAGVNLLISIATLVSSLLINVPINSATGDWTVATAPGDWREVRGRWMAGHTFRTAATLPMLASAITAALLE